MSEVSDKLLAVHRERAVSERTDKMFAALRTWRAEIIAALAERSTAIGDAAHDPEMLTLCREFRLWNYVSATMHATPENLGGVLVNPDVSPW